MEIVKEALSTTEDILSLLKGINEDNRDSIIEKIEEKLAFREQLLSNINGPYNDEEMSLGRELLEKSIKLNYELPKIKDKIKSDILNLRKQKRSTIKYANPYQSMGTDGIFYDSRK